MIRNFCWLAIAAVLLLAGCKTPSNPPKSEWGETYADVVVPENYKPHDTPPFKRQDGADGKRIFGRYSYRSTSGLDTASTVEAWFERQLPELGWEKQVNEVDDNKGTMTLRYKKGEDLLVLKLAPDELKQNNERFSILTVEMNPAFGN